MNPLSCKAIVEACVLPVCLSGCTNWILTETLASWIRSLECFQAQLGKRALNLSHSHNRLSPLMGLKWPTMRVRILSQKLSRLLDPTSSSKHTSVSSEMIILLLYSSADFWKSRPYHSKFTDSPEFPWVTFCDGLGQEADPLRG